MPGFWRRLLGGDAVDGEVGRTQNAGAKLTAWKKTRWQQLGQGPNDRVWAESWQASFDALDAYRNNPLARQIVRVTTAYVLGGGIRVHSHIPDLESWVTRFWQENVMDARLWQWSEALVMDGEIFPVLYLRPDDGMVLVRARPRNVIDAIDADPDDYERELRYHEMPTYAGGLDAEGRWWKSIDSLRSNAAMRTPTMVHYAVNRPIGALRGEGDIVPLLPWLRRYQDWLLDRAKLNKYRSRFYWWVKLTGASDDEIDEARERYSSPPGDGSIIVTSDREEWSAVTPRIEAGDAKADGEAIEKMIAGGAGQPPHWFGEQTSGTRATAESANAPAFKILSGRQQFFTWCLHDLVSHAARRAHLAGRLFAVWPEDLELYTDVPDLTRDDNLALAQSAEAIANALDKAVSAGWVDAETAGTWLSRFAGEKLGRKE